MNFFYLLFHNSKDMNTLAIKHPHSRDKYIDFREEDHSYTITFPGVSNERDFTSVTTWIHTLFEDFDADKIIENIRKGNHYKKSKYFGKSNEEIKEEWESNRNNSATLGTKMHYHIERFYNQQNVQDVSTEYKYFLAFEKNRLLHDKEKHWIPFRTEWTVFHEDYFLAGSIDMIFEDPVTNTLKIFDWKRSKEIKMSNPWHKFAIVDSVSSIPDTNFWHYTLQLNMYRFILESKYNKVVDLLCLVCLHPDNKNKSYMRLKVPILSTDIVLLMEHRLKQLKQ